MPAFLVTWCGHRFALSAGIFRISHVVVNMSALLVSGRKVSLVFDAPYIKVAARGPTLLDGRADSEVDELERFHKAAVRKFLDGHDVLSE